MYSKTEIICFNVCKIIFIKDREKKTVWTSLCPERKWYVHLIFHPIYKFYNTIMLIKASKKRQVNVFVKASLADMFSHIKKGTSSVSLKA
jgi:hypothetical protein